MRVVGPNGSVLDVPEPIATGLVGDGSRGYRYAPVESTEKPAERPKTRRRRSTRGVAE